MFPDIVDTHGHSFKVRLGYHFSIDEVTSSATALPRDVYGENQISIEERNFVLSSGSVAENSSLIELHEYKFYQKSSQAYHLSSSHISYKTYWRRSRINNRS